MVWWKLANRFFPLSFNKFYIPLSNDLAMVQWGSTAQFTKACTVAKFPELAVGDYLFESLKSPHCQNQRRRYLSREVIYESYML